jgi:hypothetical protein
MLTQHIYTPLENNWDEKIKKCCKKPIGETPPGSDCCYDSWTEELKNVNKAYKKADEDARQKTAEFNYVSEQRDMFKKWYDELTKANELEKAICDQLNILSCQVEKISTNTEFTVGAVMILFCMIRDYYLQLDKLKVKYDALLNCIKCLNSTTLVPGDGLMKLIEEYGVKLMAAQALRDELLKMVMTALALTEKINLNIGPDYGLQTIVSKWKQSLNCDEECGDGKKKIEPQPCHTSSTGVSESGDCEFKPVLKLPICNDMYYGKIDEKYKNDKIEADQLQIALLDLNKKKESLLACKQSLESAIKEVDPKERCK